MNLNNMPQNKNFWVFKIHSLYIFHCVPLNMLYFQHNFYDPMGKVHSFLKILYFLLSNSLWPCHQQWFNSFLMFVLVYHNLFYALYGTCKCIQIFLVQEKWDIHKLSNLIIFLEEIPTMYKLLKMLLMHCGCLNKKDSYGSIYLNA